MIHAASFHIHLWEQEDRKWHRLLLPARSCALTLSTNQYHYGCPPIFLALAEATSLTQVQTTSVIDALVSLAYKNAKNSFTLPGLGKLVLQSRNARVGRNPATGAEIQIPAKNVVKFKVSKAAQEAILGAANPPVANPPVVATPATT